MGGLQCHTLCLKPMHLASLLPLCRQGVRPRKPFYLSLLTHIMDTASGRGSPMRVMLWLLLAAQLSRCNPASLSQVPLLVPGCG